LEQTAANEEERHEQFLFKRQIVLQLVQRVEIRKGRKLKTVFKLDVPELLSSTSKEGSIAPTDLQISWAGTYSRVSNIKSWIEELLIEL